jgi:ABC-type antimicrobial peptide transport system permease subunit
LTLMGIVALVLLVDMFSGIFGALSLLLAALGLYGVTAHAVGRRRPEIAIRMALGAAPGTVVRMILWQVGLPAASGIAAGVAVSLWASQFVAVLLYDVAPRDPATLAAGAAILAVVSALAGWVPARRASRIDPTHLLREG